jgi:hypothetical protein
MIGPLEKTERSLSCLAEYSFRESDLISAPPELVEVDRTESGPWRQIHMRGLGVPVSGSGTVEAGRLSVSVVPRPRTSPGTLPQLLLDSGTRRSGCGVRVKANYTSAVRVEILNSVGRRPGRSL